MWIFTHLAQAAPGTPASPMPSTATCRGETSSGADSGCFHQLFTENKGFCVKERSTRRDGRVLERHFLKEFLPAVPKSQTKALGTPKEPERSPVSPFVDQVFPQGHPGWPHTNISPSPPRHPLRCYQAPVVPDRSGSTVTPRWDGAIVPGAVCRCSGSTENPAALICGCDLPPLPPSSPFNRGRIYPGGKTSLGTVFFSEGESLFPPFCNLGWRRAGFYYSYLFFFLSLHTNHLPRKGAPFPHPRLNPSNIGSEKSPERCLSRPVSTRTVPGDVRPPLMDLKAQG